MMNEVTKKLGPDIGHTTERKPVVSIRVHDKGKSEIQSLSRIGIRQGIKNKEGC